MKEKEILKSSKRKAVNCLQGSSPKAADFSTETLQAGRDWQQIFKVMKSKDLQPTLLCPAKLSFRMGGQIKCFPDKVKLEEFIIIKPLLYEMLQGFIF